MTINHWIVVFNLLLYCQLFNSAVIPSVNSQIKVSQEIIEGDIVVDQSLQRVVHDAANYGAKKIRKRRDTISYHQKRWKNAIVPFVIDPSLGKVARRSIRLGLYEFHENTCLWFTPRKNETDYVRFVSGTGCYSSIGRQGGEQIVSVGPGCIQKAQIMHEVMHAIGFFHENSRYDRDHHVKVLWWNIQPGAEKNFLTYNHGRLDTLQIPYDKHSLMHYKNKDFTKNSADTIQAIENPTESLGGNSLSKLDLKQVLTLYKCKKPRYRVRRERCKDKHKIVCLTFLTYPEACSFHSAYTSVYCRRTCRFCDAHVAHH